MSLAQWKCGLGCGWITYCPELYGQGGPVELHFLTIHDHLFHESNERPATNGPLTVGLMSEKGATDMAPEATVTTERDPFADVSRHLRLNGHGGLADRLDTVVGDIDAAKRETLAHYEGVLAEARAS